MKRKKLIKKLEALGFEVDSIGDLLFNHSEIVTDNIPGTFINITDIEKEIIELTAKEQGK